mmetsp:Transcript_2353/g.6407  ORF Transcript_2353/g.6407 Transcript_2353/m.6407 type:complete len:442 (-) Transcript_2353:459-1784(-)
MLGGDRPLVVKFANSPKASRTETGSGQNNRCQGYASQGRASHPSHSNGPSSENRGSSGYKLFVGMVPFSSSEADIEAVFAPFGQLMEVFLMREKDGKSKGCAFVRYYSQHAANMACATLNGTMALPGCARTLVVKYADADSRPGRPGGGEVPPPGFFGMQGMARVPGEADGWMTLPAGSMLGPMASPMAGHTIIPTSGMMPIGMSTAMSGQQFVHARMSGMIPHNVATYQFIPAGMPQLGVHADPGQSFSFPTTMAHQYAAVAVMSPPDSPSWMGTTPNDPNAVPPVESPEVCHSSASTTSDAMSTNIRGWEKLYVSNLPPHVQEHEVHHLFSSYGSVQEMQVLRRPDGSAKGTAFVTYRYGQEGHAAASALNGQILSGSSHALNVRPSTRKSSSRRSSSSTEKRAQSPAAMHGGAPGDVRGDDGKANDGSYPKGVVAPPN